MAVIDYRMARKRMDGAVDGLGPISTHGPAADHWKGYLIFSLFLLAVPLSLFMLARLWWKGLLFDTGRMLPIWDCPCRHCAVDRLLPHVQMVYWADRLFGKTAPAGSRHGRGAR